MFSKKSPSGKHMFNLRAVNGQIILSSELYESKKAAENGIASAKKNAGNDARFERKESKIGQPYFVLNAANGQSIGKSEMYAGKSGMENGIASVKKNADARVEDNV